MKKTELRFAEYLLCSTHDFSYSFRQFHKSTLACFQGLHTFRLWYYAGDSDLIFEVLRLCFPAWKCLRRLEVHESTYGLDTRVLAKGLKEVVGVEGGGVLDWKTTLMDVDFLEAKCSDVWEVKGGGGVLCWKSG